MQAIRKGRASALFRFLLSAAFAASASLTYAQKYPKIGITLAGSPPDRFAEAFRLGLAEHGWVDGKNIVVEYRFAAGRSERYAGFIAEFVRLKVDVIVAGGGTVAQEVAKEATRTIPIVMPASGDPVRSGLVGSLARPGGNMTGLSIMIADTSAKRVELLREAFPKVNRVAFLLNPEVDFGQQDATAAAARRLGLTLQVVTVRKREDFDAAFEAIAKAQAEAVLVSTSAFLTANRRRILDLVERHRLVGLYDNRQYVEAGGLLSYGADIADLYRVSAKYVDKILKGAKPGDLPIEQPTKFELLLNMRAARALAVELPRGIVIRADQVIE